MKETPRGGPIKYTSVLTNETSFPLPSSPSKRPASSDWQQGQQVQQHLLRISAVKVRMCSDDTG